MTARAATTPALTLTLARVVRNTWVQAAAITVAFFVVYYLTCAKTTPYDQYVRLADALLHGRVYLTPDQAPAYLELSRYFPNGGPCHGQAGCRAFVIDPPAPALLLVPFVAVFGPTVNPVVVSVLYGSVAMGLFWVAARRLGWDARVAAGVVVLAGLGTDLWWTVAAGGLWSFSQTVAVLFMMAAFVEAASRRRAWLVGLLLGLAGLSRLPVFLGFPVFLYLTLRPDKDAAMGWGRETAQRAAGFVSAFGAMAGVYLAYNYARFGTIADRGYSDPQYVGQPWFAQGRFNVAYIPRHIEAIFWLQPKLTDHFPFFMPSVAGMALFLVTPAFLCAFAARRAWLEAAAAASIALVAIPHVLHGTTGWSQYGYRYSLDYLPMLLVLTMSGMGFQMSRRRWLVIGLSVFMAMWGPLFFFDTRLEDLIGMHWSL